MNMNATAQARFHGPTQRQHEESGCTDYLQHRPDSCPHLVVSPVRKEQMAVMAVAHLRDARDLLRRAGCKKTADRVRHALRSAEGAVRNARRFADQENNP